MKKALFLVMLCIVLINMMSIQIFADTFDVITPMYVPHTCHEGTMHLKCQTVEVPYEDPPGEQHMAWEYYCCCGMYMGYMTDG